MIFALKDLIARSRKKLAKRKSQAEFFFDESKSRFPSKESRPTDEEVTLHASLCVVQIECGDASCTAIALGGGMYWAPRSVGETALQAKTHVTACYPGHKREERRLFPLCYANDIPAHPLDARHALMLSTYELILRRVVLMHASEHLPSFIPQVSSEGPETTWREATDFCFLYDPANDIGEFKDPTFTLTPEPWAFQVRAEASLVGFSDPSVSTVHTTKGREVDLKYGDRIPEPAWYAYHTCESTNTMSGGAIIAPKDAGEVDSSLAGMSLHSTRSEIKTLNYNLMIPVKNPLFCTLLLVFVWPYVWKCGTPRQKEVYAKLFASVGPVVMYDLADKLDSTFYAQIKPSWDDLLRHSRFVSLMSPSEPNVDRVDDIPGFPCDPDEYDGVNYLPDGRPLPMPPPYPINNNIVYL
ncbi:hypothetical protein CYLTODRAFT_492392 [Cylindrobasidium torrendii FP15055 ss-10]|uniref:Uncharacterized protein n=1 Tax=Cylindrobasidium torrendii FP15055 ss-10 TaxID=1314674 RepID=A0A0D7B4G4_9AGAR|nr:hypothetical protein CYLTODRAFT_492392 [Cylindrobasidium torrendii FP15055 ss-10]